MMKTNRNRIMFFVAFAISCLFLTPSAFGETLKDSVLDVPFTLKIKNTANIDSQLHLTLLDISEDSRCPIDVTCIWKGTVVAKVNLTKGDQSNTFSLGMDGDKQIIDGYLVQLIAVEPSPSGNIPIKSSDYSLTFIVSKDDTRIVAPLKQFKAGVPTSSIQCKVDLFIVLKPSNSSPVCVRSNTMEKLLLRGWTEIGDTSSIQPTIKTGTYAGHCIGYCENELIITPKKITYSQNGREFVSDKWSVLPEKTKEAQISETDWNKLIALVDFEKFNSLPDKVGCPGCADAPVEWIEISYGEKTKRIEFEQTDKIPEIDKLIIALQEIRNRMEPSVNS